MTITFAQLSDLHLDGNAATRHRLQRIAGHIAALPTPVDAIVVSGDIVECAAFPEDDDGAALAEYRLAHDILSSLAPVAYCPGNSDADAFDQFCADLGISATGGNARLDLDGVSLLLATSRVPDAYHGHLDAATVDWLDGELARTSSPAMLVMHHPPVPFGHPVIDDLRLDNPEALADLIQRFPPVLGILCGHTHAAASTAFAGRLLFVAPGVHSYGQLPWAYTEGTRALIDPMTPPGYALHRIEADRLISFPILLDRSEVDR